LTAAGYSSDRFLFFDIDSSAAISFEEWCIGWKAINTFTSLLSDDGKYYDDGYYPNYGSPFDINMDGEIGLEELVLGETWMHNWIYNINAANDTTVLKGLFDGSDSYSLSDSQILALASNFDDNVDLEMYLE
jgi:hypothetical protein